MLNLIELLPEKDKEMMTEYIHLYGIGKNDFVGIDEYLEYWAKSKKTLYKILGDKFQVEIPISYEKPIEYIRKDFVTLLDNHDFIKEFKSVLEMLYANEVIDADIRYIIYEKALTSRAMSNNKVETRGFKFKRNNKTLQVQSGMKPIKVIQNVLKFFHDEMVKECPAIDEYFEDFRIKHSLVLNDKIVKGTLVLSIHPFDYITMSDNDSNWSSCMSWTEDGCYHVGTVEMMNSNNVICAYIKSSSDYHFSKENSELVWNNKKWRQLIYMTKDIIVSGKPYPYVNKEITLKAIGVLKELAKTNKNWDYSYGPELYLDMTHIYSVTAMNNNRDWLYGNNSFKHNILFDTRGMYNDMLNDRKTEYWCYRNKVPKMRIISYSGKANCACCNTDDLLEPDCMEYYNDRFDNTGSVVCEECRRGGSCYECGRFRGKNSLYSVGTFKNFCKECIDRKLRICPCCGETIITKQSFWCGSSSTLLGLHLEGKQVCYNHYYQLMDRRYFFATGKELQKLKRDRIVPYDDMQIVPVFCCEKCRDNLVEKGLFHQTLLPGDPEYIKSYPWHRMSDTRYISTKTYTPAEIAEHPLFSHMLYDNLDKNLVKIPD